LSDAKCFTPVCFQNDSVSIVTPAFIFGGGFLATTDTDFALKHDSEDFLNV